MTNIMEIIEKAYGLRPKASYVESSCKVYKTDNGFIFRDIEIGNLHDINPKNNKETEK